MTKKEFVKEFQEVLKENGVEVSIPRCNEILTDTLDKIPALLIEEGEINLTGFGKFSLVEVSERSARNPKTGEELVVPEHKAMRFKPSQKVKEQVK